MLARRRHINRVLPRNLAAAGNARPESGLTDGPRKVGRTVVNFSVLGLPSSVRAALEEAFWSQVGVRSDATLLAYWNNVRVFARFMAETQLLRSLRDAGSALLLVRYVEWLNKQCGQDGEPWSKGTRAMMYMSLRTLLQWLLRCRPDLIGEIEFPANPFPWRNRDSGTRERLPAQDLRAILTACEQDITALRALRENADKQMAAARVCDDSSISTLGELLHVVDQRYGGLLPPWSALRGPAHLSFLHTLKKCGGSKIVSLCLYPRAESLLPYYLAILIHTAGNPQAIAGLSCDCLQPIPLLDDRELLVWKKARAGAPQRRAFRRAASFEPPALVREIIQWTQRLRPYAKADDLNRLFLFRTKMRVGAFTPTTANILLPGSFFVRHHLPHFALASIRSAVLTAFYRASGDLRQVRAIANHAQLSTTVRYVESPEVRAQNRLRVATLQSAWLGHLDHSPPNETGASNDKEVRSSSVTAAKPPTGAMISMFGFNCRDAFAGIAPGTRRGELCTHFLGCFTCPNAVITAEPNSVARLLQARAHLQAGSAYLHPARWDALYAPQLRILEEDILTRFSERELTAAAPLLGTLPSLPDLR